jgi:uncharacterized protein (TIGR04255 family)
LKLENPPVIQTWIGFRFSPSPKKKEWDRINAFEFLSRYRESLEHIEALYDETVHIEQVSLHHSPKVKREIALNRIRARDEASSRWLQIADDQMVFNVMRQGQASLNYSVIRDESLAKFDDYVAFFQPSFVDRIELHYVDLIEIPKPQSGKLNMEEYFKLRVEVPDEFGATWHFALRAFLLPTEQEEIVEVRFQSEIPEPDSEFYCFRTDWHCTSINIRSLERSDLAKRLDSAHAQLLKCFRESVTELTWDLFKPVKEPAT